MAFHPSSLLVSSPHILTPTLFLWKHHPFSEFSAFLLFPLLKTLFTLGVLVKHQLLVKLFALPIAQCWFLSAAGATVCMSPVYTNHV